MARIPIFPTEKRRRTRPTVNPNSSAQVIELPVSPNPSAYTWLEMLIVAIIKRYRWERETAKSYDWQPMPNGQRTMIGNHDVKILRDQDGWTYQIECQDTGESQSSETRVATSLDAKIMAVGEVLDDEDRPQVAQEFTVEQIEYIEYIAATVEACLEADSSGVRS